MEDRHVAADLFKRALALSGDLEGARRSAAAAAAVPIAEDDDRELVEADLETLPLG